jgi:hypothetical protein
MGVGDSRFESFEATTPCKTLHDDTHLQTEFVLGVFSPKKYTFADRRQESHQLVNRETHCNDLHSKKDDHKNTTHGSSDLAKTVFFVEVNKYNSNSVWYRLMLHSGRSQNANDRGEGIAKTCTSRALAAPFLLPHHVNMELWQPRTKPKGQPQQGKPMHKT